MAIFTKLKNIQLLFVCLLLTSSFAYAQRSWKKMDKQASFGLVNGTLNFRDNVSNGLSFGFGFNLFSVQSSSLSFGTNIKFGFENKYGLGILALAANMLSDGAGPTEGNNLADFAEFPLFLHYNYGYGSNSKSEKKFGFYIGSGMSYLITGYDNGIINSYSTSFWGWSIDAGIRFSHFEFGLSRVNTLSGPITGIPNPAFYQATISFFVVGNKETSK
jgi:hypothetical protein